MSEEKDSYIQTPLGFRDITKALKDDSLAHFQQYDVIREIFLEQVVSEFHQQEGEVEIGHFQVPDFEINGRVFPQDELIRAGEIYDLIIRAYKPVRDAIRIDCNVYHDLEVGERIPVKISRKDSGENPSFKLFNRIGGFVKNWRDPKVYLQIILGSKVLVEVREVRRKQGRTYVMTSPINLIT